MALTRYAKKPSKTYSGGNKRKLSAAIALLGNPSVIFMVSLFDKLHRTPYTKHCLILAAKTRFR